MTPDNEQEEGTVDIASADLPFDPSEETLDLPGTEVAGLASELGGLDLFGHPMNRPPVDEPLRLRFLVPPFSVLDGRQGYWQERKQQWLSIGIQSEVGRGENLLKFSDAVNARQAGVGKTYDDARNLSKAFNTKGTLRTKSFTEMQQSLTAGQGGDVWSATGTSIFDPVLCELAYRWFCPASGLILDPFAGGSVRGIVASKLGRRYIGFDLRGEQVHANQAQGRALCSDPQPVWICADSLGIAAIEQTPEMQGDFLFTCPPYFDLEKYSSDPADLSTMSDEDFLSSYRHIIRLWMQRLKPDRFAAIVIGEVRGKDGYYRNFYSETIRAFELAGARLYNECAFITPTGSLALRTQKQFMSSRKVGRTHQYLLVFCNGDWKKAAAACSTEAVWE